MPNLAGLNLPSSVTLLEAQIDRRKAAGQRFPKEIVEDATPTDHFRSARRAPNERVRNSVKAHGSSTRRVEPPAVLSEKPPRHEASLSPPKRRPGEEMEFGETVDPAGMTGSGDTNPFRVGMPQRVEPPKDLNTPLREHDGTVNVDEMDIAAKEDQGRAAGADSSVSRRQASTTKVKDQEMLAFACRRANKTRNEALAYYNMGVLHDNDKEYDKANRCYEQYLQAARAAGDSKGEQLALNSVGINHYKLRQYEAAVEVHSQHNAIADVPGKFVAHCNLGLAYSQMGDLEKSSLNHRQALRYAIVMSSLVGESLACGNLGIVAGKMGDARTAKACMERHLKLAVALKDGKSQLEAYQHLGLLSNEAGEYLESTNFYEQARSLAMDMHDVKTAQMAKVMIGMARGNAQYEEYVASIADQLDQPQFLEDSGDEDQDEA